MADDGLVEFIPGDLDGFRHDDAVERQDRHVRGPAADIHDHVSVGARDVQSGSEGGGDGLLDQEDPACSGLKRGVVDGSLLHLGDAGGDADNDAGLEKRDSQRLLDEVLDHILGQVVLADHPVPQGADGDDIAGGASEHLLGFAADLHQLIGLPVYGDDGRFFQDDAPSLDVDEHRGGTEIDTDIFAHASNLSSG